MSEALRSLESLGFVDLEDGEQVRLRSALFRFADPVRGRDDVVTLLEQLVREGEVAVEDPADAPEDDSP